MVDIAVGDVHHQSGQYHASAYWGAPSSNVDWCELNYEHSPYVAEWWNTWSSAAIVIVSCFGLWLCRRHKYERRFVVCYALLALVGVGSALFHGTLHWAGQALDELPMVYTSLAFLYAILQTQSAPPLDPQDSASEFDGVPTQTRLNFEHCLPPPGPGSPAAVANGAAANGYANAYATTTATAAAGGWSGDPAGGFYGGAYGIAGGGGSGWSEDDEMMEYLGNALVLFGALFTVAYLTSADLFRWFLLVYIGAIVILFRKSMAIWSRSTTPRHQKVLIAVSFALYGAGFVLCWIPGEVLFPCEMARRYHLHAWFHLTGAFGPFTWLSMAVWQRFSYTSKKPALVWHPLTAPLPYVAVPIKEHKPLKRSL